MASGKLRVVAITAPQRLAGALAQVPTWKEQGVEVVFGAWRAIFAPKGLTPQQTAYWEGVLRKATGAPEWKEDLEKNYWANVFVPGERSRRSSTRITPRCERCWSISGLRNKAALA